MRIIDGHRYAALSLCAALGLGCSSPNGKLTQIQQDKEQLLVAIRDQRDRNRQLQGQVVSLESRLDQAEKELARSGGGTRLSALPAKPSVSGNTAPPAKSESRFPAKRESLPWRAPSGKAIPPPAGSDR